jgi:hypothetical protein
MRSLSADAAIVAAPTLAASYLAVWGGDRLLAAAPPEAWLPHELLLLPLYAVLGMTLTWLFYQTVAGMLEYRAISTTNGRGLFIFLAVLTTAFTAYEAPGVALQFAAAAMGAAFTLQLIRRRPSRRISAN